MSKVTERINSYISLIPADFLDDSDFFEKNKQLLRYLFNNLDEKNITLSSSSQMREILFGVKAGLLVEQIVVYCNPELSWEQMRMIEEALKDGVPVEKIKPVVNAELSEDIIKDVKREYIVEQNKIKREKIANLLFDK